MKQKASVTNPNHTMNVENMQTYLGTKVVFIFPIIKCGFFHSSKLRLFFNLNRIETVFF